MGAKITPGPWVLATSNSWRRFVARDGGNVCEPITQNDGHPDLHFSNGGADGPDARLIAAAPELLAELEKAHALLQLALRHMSDAGQAHFAAASEKAGLGTDGATRHHERAAAIAKATGAAS
jgi:hypothetical protein